ncbi:hypothetical protein ABZZ20_25605 [Streptomyces sp. NPDC006430]|uniref:hypothetical protein n=1 Tax=Streptomyces sp. NPDC006430 TaxID=3154299 RepID=UPI0033AA563A
MANDALPFRYEQHLVTDEDLLGWRVERAADGRILAVFGPCPNCGHLTRQNVEESVLTLDYAERAAGAGEATPAPLPPPTARMTRICDCACNVAHANGSAKPVMSCGSWWLVTIALDEGAVVPVRAATDASLLPALRAVQEVTTAEESRLRSSAEKWIAAVTALVGLFGLTGVVVGKDAFTGLSPWARGCAGGAALLAAAFAAAAITQSYRAAYGWPVVVDLGNDQLLTTWFAGRRTHLSQAAAQLRRGVRWALAALAALVVALGCIWFWPRTAPAGAFVEVTRADDSTVCGTLLDSTTERGLRIRRPNGTVETVGAAELGPVRIVNSCAGGTG